MEYLKTLINETCPNGVPYKKLGEIATISRGGSLQKKISVLLALLAFTTDKSIPGMACLQIGLSLLSARTAPKSKS